MTDRTAGVPRLSWAEVCARRLVRHALSTPSPDARPADIAGVICGAHAQIMSAAELSLGLRIDGITREQIRQALWTEHSLIKTFGPRGTVHLLAAEDLPIWTGALSALPTSYKGHAQSVRLSPEQTDQVVAAIAIALEDAELTIDELSEAVITRAGAWAGELVMPAFQGMWPRWRQAVATAANRGVLCFGPNRGRNVTYTNPRRWLPGFQPAANTSALAGVVRRYLYAYGPATPQQFARWINAPLAVAAGLFTTLADELQQVELDGTLAWLPAGDTAMPAIPPQGVRLLPYFDAYAVGCYPRDLLFPGPAAERALTGGQAGNLPVLLVDGTVAGLWHLRRSGKKLAITVEPFGRLSDAQRRELDDQVERIGIFLEGNPNLTIGTVTIGPHA